MAEILNYFEAGAPHEVIHRAVEKLANGKLVGLPFDTCYAVCGIATDEQIPEVLGASDPEATWALACPGVEFTMECLGPLSQLQLRLISRLCPGPVLLRVHGIGCGSVLDSLPAAVVSLVQTQGVLQLVVPESPLCRQIMHLLPGPLIQAVSGSRNTGEDAAELGHRSAAHAGLIVDAGPTMWRYPLTTLDVSGDSWGMVRPGAIPERTVAEAGCHQVLFVCTGNTCRSPMAERLFRKMLARELDCPEDDLIEHGVAVRSAGLAAFDGAPASGEAVELLRERGIELGDHQSRRANARLLLHADYVVTMTRAHRETILQQYPQLADRVRTVADDGTDVSDPFGAGIEEYRRCRNELEEYLETFASSFINEVAGGKTT